jgi:hypothetical protein
MSLDKATSDMKTLLNRLILALILATPVICMAQEFPEEQVEPYRIHTIFRTGKYASGGYAALSNKFTTIDGKFANMPEIYGGWFVNHKFMVGLGFAATTNNIEVPSSDRTLPEVNMSYEYGQAGLMLEYTLWSHRALHLSFQFFNGGAFTVQYQRGEYYDDHYWDDYGYDNEHDSNFFFVTEPGVKVELNVFKWMRFCPGISYRMAYGSDGIGLKDKDVSAPSMNFTLKFGKF